MTAKTGVSQFGTICVAMVTPFGAEGELDVDAGRRLAAHLVQEGCDSLVLAGTTGESPTTSLEEKRRLLQAVKDEVGDQARLIMGVGTYNTAETIARAQDAAAHGADALLVVTPYYSKPSQEGLYQHFRAVAQATDLPVCLYDIPGRSGVPLSSDVIRRLAELPTVQAVKDAKGDITSATRLIEETGLAWYSGDDPLNVPWLSVGASGFISVIGHVAARRLREIYECVDAGDLVTARKKNAELAPLVAAQGRLGGVSMAKAALRLQGIEVGDPRLPIVAANEKQVEELRTDLNKAGVL